MAKKEIEERIELLEKLGGIIREEARAYGIIDAVWGLAVFIGAISFQVVEILSIPWYYGFTILIISLLSAFISTPLLKKRIEKSLGYSKGGWLSERIKMSWLAVALIGGTSYMLVFWSPPVTKVILNNLSSAEISGFILMGWLIIDGIGSMVQGIISESKAYTIIGVLMVGSAVVVANIGFIYAWSAFALTYGLGYLSVGLKDYTSFKRSVRAGVKVE